MVAQDILWKMVKEHPGHIAEYYAKILANGDESKIGFYTKDVFSAFSSLKKWKFVIDEWDFVEDGIKVHYYPINSLEGNINLEYSPINYSHALVEDRMNRGWPKESAEYAFPSKAKCEFRYLSKFSKGIMNYIRKNEGCSFGDIGDYLRSVHHKQGYVPRCIFNAHLDVVLKDLINEDKLSVVDGKYYRKKVKN